MLYTVFNKSLLEITQKPAQGEYDVLVYLFEHFQFLHLVFYIVTVQQINFKISRDKI